MDKGFFVNHFWFLILLRFVRILFNLQRKKHSIYFYDCPCSKLCEEQGVRSFIVAAAKPWDLLLANSLGNLLRITLLKLCLHCNYDTNLFCFVWLTEFKTRSEAVRKTEKSCGLFIIIMLTSLYIPKPVKIGNRMLQRITSSNKQQVNTCVLLKVRSTHIPGKVKQGNKKMNHGTYIWIFLLTKSSYIVRFSKVDNNKAQMNIVDFCTSTTFPLSICSQSLVQVIEWKLSCYRLLQDSLYATIEPADKTERGNI